MEISSNFDAGKIGVVSAERAQDIRLKILPDNAADFAQWFFFRLTGARGVETTMTFVNAGEAGGVRDTAGMPDTWEDYQVLASYDRRHWFRIPTEYDHEVLRCRITPQYDGVFIANFVPYSMERHHRLVARAAMSPRVRLSVLGRTPDGQDLDLLTISEPERGEPGADKKKCWFMARQHPSETAGSWLMEGVLARLLDPEDAIAKALLKRAVFYVVPNMNPDGSRRGNTRTNAKGANLNREWQNPSLERSPEVWHVRNKMEEVGIDFCVDAHAWSGTHMFALGPYNTPSITPTQTALWQRYEAALARANPDFEVGWTYPGGGPAPGKADCAMAWNYISEAYGAMGVLYELLYKDNRNNPDPERGWSAARSHKMGAATLDALYAIVDELGR